MADIEITKDGIEIARYSPAGLATEGTLSMEPRAMRNIYLCYRAVVTARHERGLEVSQETDSLLSCLHSLISDAEFRGERIEIIARKNGEKKD